MDTTSTRPADAEPSFRSQENRSASSRRSRRRFLAAVAVGVALTGCASDAKLQPPVATQSPWDAERTWAVLPFANESGVSAVDAMALADQFAIEIDAVERMNCVPVNRAIAAMRAAGINSINSESDARTVLAILQVDAVLLGTVTAYDSYRPLQLGVAVRVISVERSDSATADATALTMATGEPRNQTTPGSPPPSLQVSRVYDANNHGTLSSVKAYAAGREDPKSGLRGTAYLVSMERYSRFVAYDVVRSLLAEEAARRASRPDLADAPTE